jgi:hypothetical protein
MSELEPPSGDRLLASAARFLIDAGQDDAASVLLACELEVDYSGTGWIDGGWEIHECQIQLQAPASAYQALLVADGEEWPAGLPSETPVFRPTVEGALNAVLPAWITLKALIVRAQLIDLDPDWRNDLLEIARGHGVSNQGIRIDRPPIRWQNLGFRSQSEVRIAQALDRANVLFLTNCMARLGVTADHRVNREADFLVCAEGRFGILEVDGEPFHPATRAAQDHARDRLFLEHGVLVVHHFDANECFETPDQVVTEFLRLLAVGRR